MKVVPAIHQFDQYWWGFHQLIELHHCTRNLLKLGPLSRWAVEDFAEGFLPLTKNLKYTYRETSFTWMTTRKPDNDEKATFCEANAEVFLETLHRIDDLRKIFVPGGWGMRILACAKAGIFRTQVVNYKNTYGTLLSITTDKSPTFFVIGFGIDGDRMGTPDILKDL